MPTDELVRVIEQPSVGLDFDLGVDFGQRANQPAQDAAIFFEAETRV